MTAAQTAYMLVSLGYSDESCIDALRAYDLPPGEAEELVRDAHTERAANLAEQDTAIEVERQAARASERDTATKGG